MQYTASCSSETRPALATFTWPQSGEGLGWDGALTFSKVSNKARQRLLDLQRVAVGS